MLKYLLLIGVVLFSQIRGELITHTELHKNGRIDKITYHKKVLIKGVNGIVPVKLEEYYRNGTLYKEENYSKKYPYGYMESTTKWYKNGQKKMEEKYKDGKEDGVWTRWYENGQKRSEETWKDGKRISSKTWYEDGSEMNWKE